MLSALNKKADNIQTKKTKVMKSYSKPNTIIVEIENKSIIAASLPINSGTTTDKQLAPQRNSDWSDYEN